jgi:hypothetical protein
VTEYKRGRTSIQDEQRCGLPKSVTAPEMVAKIHDVVLKDRRLKLPEIDFTRAGVQYFNPRIGYEKAIGGCRTLDQKLVRMQILQECLDCF